MSIHVEIGAASDYKNCKVKLHRMKHQLKTFFFFNYFFQITQFILLYF